MLYLTGGVTDKDSNDVPYVVQEVADTPNSAITSATGGRGPEFYITFNANSTGSFWLDDINSYTPNSFVSSMEQPTDVPVGGPITVSYTHLDVYKRQNQRFLIKLFYRKPYFYVHSHTKPKV